MFGLLILFPCCTVIKLSKAKERNTISNVSFPMRGNLEIYKNIIEREKISCQGGTYNVNGLINLYKSSLGEPTQIQEAFTWNEMFNL